MVPVKISNEKQCVDARELHQFLETGRDFSTWIKDRIEEYGFTEGEDYIIKSFDSPDLGNQKRGVQKRGGDRRSIDYTLSLGMAKELAMVERSYVGRQVRRYFIEVEKEYRNQFGKYGTYLLYGKGVRYVKTENGVRYSCLVDVERALHISRVTSIKASGLGQLVKTKLVGARGEVYCVTDVALWALKQKSKIMSIPDAKAQMAFAFA
jgi:phage anti-repressor protein